MDLLLILCSLILSIIAIIFAVRTKQYGIIVAIVGLYMLFHHVFSWEMSMAMAANPGIIWQNEDGISYSDLYRLEAEKAVPWIIISALVIFAGILWTILQYIFRHRKLHHKFRQIPKS